MFFVAAAAVGCAPGDAPPTGTAAEIAERVFSEASVAPLGPSRELASDEDSRYFLGSAEYPRFVDTAIVEAPTGVDAHIVYILRTGSGRDAAAVLRRLDRDVDPDRLLAISFTRADVRMDRRGSVVFLVIDANQAQRNALANAFAVIE